MKYLLNSKELCKFCNKVGQVVYLKTDNHIANICPLCNMRRIGKPYITRKKFNRLIELDKIRAIN